MRNSAASAFESSIIYKGLVISTYLTLNITLNLLQKWVLSHFGFKFPLFLSMSHMLFSFFALAPIMCMKAFRELHKPTLQKQWIGLAGVGVFFAINIGFNNMSLTSISLSLNQVIRASIPLVTAVGAVFIEKKVPSRQEFMSLVVLFGGVALAVYEGSDTKTTVVGIIICLLGTICNGLMMTSSGRLLSEKIDVLRLTFYTAPISCMILSPFYYHLEYNKLQVYKQQADTSKYIGVVLLTCVNALAYNMIHYLMIKVTSSVTTTVIGEMKIVLILLLSASLLGEAKIWTFKMVLGCGTAIIGFIMYSHCKLNSNSSTHWQPVIKGVPELPSLKASASSDKMSEKMPLIGSAKGSV